MSSLWCLFKTLLQGRPPYHTTAIACAALIDGVFQIISDQWSGIISLLLSYLALPYHLTTLISCPEIETEKATIKLISGRDKEEGPHIHVNRYSCLLKITYIVFKFTLFFVLVKMSIRNAKQIAFRWQCGFNEGF